MLHRTVTKDNKVQTHLYSQYVCMKNYLHTKIKIWREKPSVDIYLVETNDNVFYVFVESKIYKFCGQ